MNKRPKGYWTDFGSLPQHPLICAFDSDRGNYKGILQTGQMGEGKVQNLLKHWLKSKVRVDVGHHGVPLGTC